MAAKNLLYTLTSGQWKRYTAEGFVRYKSGDVIRDITPAEYAEHKWRLRVVEQEELDRAAATDAKLKDLLAKAAPSDNGDDEDEYDWTEILSGSVSAISSYLVNILTEPEMVESLLQAEMEGQKRKGVITAANERLVALQNTQRVGQ